MEKNQLVNDTSGQKYEYVMGEYRPQIEYQIKGNDIYLTHTRIPEELRGQGIGTELVKDVLEDIDHEGYKLVPLCGFVASYIKKHPEWTRLLKEGLYIG